MTAASTPTADQLRSTAREAGVSAWIHARRLTGPPAELGLDADETVAIASLYKLPLALVWADLVERGELPATARLTMPASDRVPGPTGVAMLLDDVTLSSRDVVRLMLAVSDNVAGDALLAHVGRDRVQQHLDELALPTTLVRHGSGEETRTLMLEIGAQAWGEAQTLLADPGSVVQTSMYDPAFATAASPSDLTEVLRILWSRTGDAHSLVRDAMAHQAWRHRVGSGFPHDDVGVFGKTGTLGQLRHEAAVVAFPHEHPVAVVVLTRAARPERHLPRVDAAIGTLARLATNSLRMPRE